MGLRVDPLFFLMEKLKLAFQTLHSRYHGLESGEGLGGLVPGFGGAAGCFFEGGKEIVLLALDVTLDRFEVPADELMRKTEKGLILTACQYLGIRA